ncbi:hypothetical protein [Qipengyuania gelatinilytica]|uniref:Uncharacterized protein n=1 Tax=Qipengyuania gelatinilytica TaxID=2867231 RepID=A0ABX9A669_9SPHN|nr:hypothetical protein [Qipengyuania gelatinilytica]QZD95302.1 hypothetical protein K3136_00805 [Qipengyuania gelatinilytica]
MTDHPSTYRGEDCHRPGIQWDDRAELHRVGDGDGVLDGAKGLRSGTFADLVKHMMLMPEHERKDYYIEKLGDREYRADEVTTLSKRDDFPRS